MNINHIECSHKKIDKIYHVSDIHIRNVKRHEEYREVLNKFYKSVSDNGTENSLIIIAGDIAHSKVETSPELVREISDLLINCAKLTDTIVFLGNHDVNLNNKTRLDVLTPIINNLNNPRIHFLKDNGLYKCRNILFSHFDIFLTPDNYITYNKIPKIYFNNIDTTIALFHGAINKALMDVGCEISNKIITADIFDGFDIAILGDIHKAQTIYIEKEIDEDELDSYIQSGKWEQLT